MTRTLKHLSCVIPAYNEAENLIHFIPAISQFLRDMGLSFDLIVVDDGSKDNSIEVLRSLVPHYPLTVLELSRNFGKEYALTAGIDHAQGDVVVLIDSDFQHPIACIKDMIALWEAGYDMVYGMRNRQSESFLKQVLTRRFYWLLQKTSRIDIPEDAGDFRLMDRQVVSALRQLPEHTRYMKGLYAWVGFKSIGVVFEEAERVAGQTSFNLRKLSGLALLALTSFSNLPLKICSVIGIVLAFLSMGYGAWIIVQSLFIGVTTPGWATLVVAMTFLGGLQLLAIGILGEYIANIYDEVKNRPNYLVARQYTSTKQLAQTPAQTLQHVTETVVIDQDTPVHE